MTETEKAMDKFLKLVGAIGLGVVFTALFVIALGYYGGKGVDVNDLQLEPVCLESEETVKTEYEEGDNLFLV